MHCDGVSLKGEMVTGSHGIMVKADKLIDFVDYGALDIRGMKYHEIRLKSVQNSHKYNLCIKWKGNEVYSFLNTSFKRKHDTYCNC